MMLPFQMPIVDLRATARALGESGKQVQVLWQEDESAARSWRAAATTGASSTSTRATS